MTAPGRVRMTVALAFCAAVWSGAAGAASRPVVLDPVYVEPVAPLPPPALSAHPCALHVVELTDARRDPDMIGMVLAKPVRTPADRRAWLTSVLGALKGRGYTVDFADPGVERPGGLNARITLQALWIDAAMDLHQSAVFHVQARGFGGQIDGFYRGSESRMNWAATDGEVKGGIATALSRALDAMAAALAPLCPAATSSKL